MSTWIKNDFFLSFFLSVTCVLREEKVEDKCLWNWQLLSTKVDPVPPGIALVDDNYWYV